MCLYFIINFTERFMLMKKFKNTKAKKKEKDLKELLKKYNSKTAEITDEKALSMLNKGISNDFLLLLEIANHARMGKAKAILTAFKLGYLQGKIPLDRDEEKEKQDNLFEVIVQLKKASTVLGAIIGNYGLEKMNLTKGEMMAVGSNASSICDLAAIASDYVSNACMDLEWTMD